MVITLHKLLATVIVTAGALSCGDKGTEPDPVDTPGTAIVSLTTPHADDGAIVVTLRGPDLSTIQVLASSHVLYSRLASSTEAKIIIVGDLTAGPLVTVRVGATNRLSAYSASVDQVAARNDSLRVSLTGYRLVLAPAP